MMMIYYSLIHLAWLPGGLVVKKMPVNSGDTGDPGSIPDQKDPLGKEWQPSSVFLP